MAKNAPKYLSYKEAWRRINAANEQGFYLEVVTICESIISDRLLSYILGVNKESKANTRTTFGNLIKEWRKLANGKLILKDQSDIGARVDAWRAERNEFIHGLVKSEPGTATQDVSSFLERAECAACKGIKLAKAVKAWHEEQPRA